jgi:hypothetical protein
VERLREKIGCRFVFGFVCAFGDKARNIEMLAVNLENGTQEAIESRIVMNGEGHNFDAKLNWILHAFAFRMTR